MSPAATVPAQWQRAALVSRAHSASALYTADTRPPLALIAQLNQRHLHSPWHCAFCLLLPSLSIHQVLRQRTMWSLVAEKYEQGPGAPLSLRTSRWRLSGAQKHHGWIGQKRGGEGASARVGQPQQREGNGLSPLARAQPLFSRRSHEIY